jgi:hypothetical protein
MTQLGVQMFDTKVFSLLVIRLASLITLTNTEDSRRDLLEGCPIQRCSRQSALVGCSRIRNTLFARLAAER